MTRMFAKFDLKKIQPYWELMRFHQPIGILLLLWPTWWALWLAADGFPKLSLLIIFTLGVAIMRAAGCVINDIADRNIDHRVSRTQQRALTSGRISLSQAKITFAVLLLIALFLVLLTNPLTIYLSFVAVALACIYPFMKRYTHLPQVVLGAAFSMSIPMAFAAQNNSLEPVVIVVYLTNLMWTVVYDTFYGMTDREYDKKIGVKSTAILFEGNERLMIGSLQVLTLAGFLLIGQRFQLGTVYTLSIVIAAGLMVYHHAALKQRKPELYFRAFIHNHWVGAVIFAGIALHYLLH